MNSTYKILIVALLSINMHQISAMKNINIEDTHDEQKHKKVHLEPVAVVTPTNESEDKTKISILEKQILNLKTKNNEQATSINDLKAMLMTIQMQSETHFNEMTAHMKRLRNAVQIHHNELTKQGSKLISLENVQNNYANVTDYHDSILRQNHPEHFALNFIASSSSSSSSSQSNQDIMYQSTELTDAQCQELLLFIEDEESQEEIVRGQYKCIDKSLNQNSNIYQSSY